METPAWQKRAAERRQFVDELVRATYELAYEREQDDADGFLFNVASGVLAYFHPDKNWASSNIAGTIEAHDWVGHIWKQCLDFGRSETETKAVAKMLLLKLLGSVLSSVNTDILREEIANPE